MGLELAKAFIRVTADTSHVKSDLNAARPGIESALGGLMGAVQSKIMMATGMISAGFGLMKVLQSAMSAEDTFVALKTMLGTAEETKKTIADLTKYAAETPFEMPEILQAAKGLITFGERGEEMMDTLRFLGNAAAGTNTQFGMLALIFNQVRGVGKLLTQDFRQLSSRGILFMQDIADFYKVDTTKAQEMLSKGKITFDEFRKILKSLSAEGGRFFQMTLEKSKTLSGLWSTFKDNLGIIGKSIGETILPYAKALLITIMGYADATRAWVEKNKELIGTWVQMTISIVTVVGALVAFVYAAKGVAKSIALIQALSGTKGLAQLAIGLAAATAAYYAIDQAMEGILDRIKMAGDAVKKAVKESKEEQRRKSEEEKDKQRVQVQKKPLEDLIKKYKEAGAEQEQIRRGLNEWQRAVENVVKSLGYYPNYLRQIQPELQKLYDQMQMFTAQNEAVKWLEDMQFKTRALKSDWDDLTESFLKAFEDPKKPGFMKEGLQQIFPTLQKAMQEFKKAQEEAKLREFGKGLTDQMKNPIERAKEELLKLDDLLAMTRRGEKGGISQETYVRRLKKMKEELKLGDTILQAGRYDFADFGKQIQDAFLRNDPAKESVVELKKHTDFLQKISTTIAMIEGKPVGLGP